MNIYKGFFERIRLLNYKYEKVIDVFQSYWNIYSILSLEYDEVNLHSKLIYELLNPNGSHKKGTSFLSLFLSQVDLNQFELEGVNVRREHKNIDILITNKYKKAIIIENKIFAGDQYKQLERYVNYLKNEGFINVYIIYLTLFGDGPSEDSLGVLDETESHTLLCLSYQEDIAIWITSCLKEVAILPVIRETLTQYLHLTRKLTGKSEVQEYIMEIADLLLDEKNIELATNITEALTEAKIKIQFAFWAELEFYIKEKGYSIQTNDYKYSQDKTEKYYKNSRNNRGFGLSFEAFQMSNNALMYCHIFVDYGIYFGFSTCNSTDTKIDHLDCYHDYVKKLSSTSSKFKGNQYFFGWKNPEVSIDFKNFNSPTVFSLANPEKRKDIARGLVEEIDEYCRAFETALKE